MISHEDDPILYLTRDDVVRICQNIDSVAVIRQTLALHEQKKTILPDEATLYWKNPEGETVRSLNMPGYIDGEKPRVGTKIINGNSDNHKRSLPRASGIFCVIDPVSARILSIMEGAHISSLRTASVSLVAIDQLHVAPLKHIGFIGAGVQTQAHINVMLKRQAEFYPQLQSVLLFDIAAERVQRIIQACQTANPESHVDFVVVASAEEVVRRSQVVVAATTTTTGYIEYGWLQPGSVIVNVSLDDVLPEVVKHANCVVVDDWTLVKNDPRRLLGRMYRAGEIVGPDEALPSYEDVRRIDGTIGDVLNGKLVARRSPNDILLVNPFGLAIEDVAIASAVYEYAQAEQIGMLLPR